MTLPQVLHTIGVDVEQPDTPPLDESAKTASRALIFDRLCARHGMAPAKLAEMPADEVAQLLKEEGQAMIDPKHLPEYVAAYVKSKNG